MIVIHVKGIPGSGKTWLGNSLKREGIPVLDTDDIFTETYIKLSKTTAFKAILNKKIKPGARPDKLLRKTVEESANAWIEAQRSNIVVVVGVLFTPKFSEEHYKYFIKLPPSTLEETYRRVMAREYKKIKDNMANIEQLIANAPVRMLAHSLRVMYHINAFEIAGTFDDYIHWYKNALKYDKKNGYKAMEQMRILETILRKR